MVELADAGAAEGAPRAGDALCGLEDADETEGVALVEGEGGREAENADGGVRGVEEGERGGEGGRIGGGEDEEGFGELGGVEERVEVLCGGRCGRGTSVKTGTMGREWGNLRHTSENEDDVASWRTHGGGEEGVVGDEEGRAVSVVEAGEGVEREVGLEDVAGRGASGGSPGAG